LLPVPSFRRAVRNDLPGIVRMLADDALGVKRESPAWPLPPGYYAAFDAIRFYESLGFVASHEGMKLELPSSP
jgi:hypothetical protein